MKNRVSRIKEELLSEARAQTSAALINEDAIIDRYKQGDSGIPQDLRNQGYTETPEETRLLVEALESAARLSRISDLGDFYRIAPEVETAPTSNRKLADVKKSERQRVMEGENLSEPLVIDGKEYIIEDFVRGTRSLDQYTPAEVFKRKQELYPEKTGLQKIEASKSTPDDSLISMLLADARRDDVSQDNQMTPVINMEKERRRASPDLISALEGERVFASGPIAGLRVAGAPGRLKEDNPNYDLLKRTGEQKNAIREVLLGDMDRGYNPRTGAPYGSPIVENGVEVRDVLNDGHGYDFENFTLFANQPWNNAMELESENKGSAAEAKGFVKPVSDTFQARLTEERDSSRNLGSLMQRVDALAAAGLLDQRRVNRLIDEVLMG